MLVDRRDNIAGEFFVPRMLGDACNDGDCFRRALDDLPLAIDPALFDRGERAIEQR